MKRIIVLGGLLFVCAAGWEVGGRLSTDALGLALGVLFGVMAGIPTAILALSASRRNDGGNQTAYAQPGRSGNSIMPYGQHPPVIIVAGAPTAHPSAMPHHLQAGQQMQYGWPQQANYGNYPPALPVGGQVIDGQAQYVDGTHARSNNRVFKLIGEQEKMIDEF